MHPGQHQRGRVSGTLALPKGTRVTAVRAGCDFSLALTTTGKVLAWGLNFEGDVGDGTTTRRLRPVLVKLPPGVRAKAISVGKTPPWR
jgi:alpha-tubulin suppressor-like RCC1 family protein